MELPVLDMFCFIFDLKTGCITMGIFNSVTSLLLALILASFAADVRASREAADQGMSAVLFTLIVMMVVLLFFKFLIDLLLIYAATKDNRVFMTKYCIFWIIFLVLFSIGFLKTLFHMDAGHVIAEILYIAENVYYIIVIRSYLMFLNANAEQLQ